MGMFIFQFFVIDAWSDEEFENYFKKELVEGRGGSIVHAQDLIQQVMDSLLDRIEIPYAIKRENGTMGSLQKRGFFKYLKSEVHRLDPGASVHLSNEIVRSLLGYIYKKIFHTKQKDPSQSTSAILQKMIHSDHEIPSFKALGFGNHLDILIQPGDPLLETQVKNRAQEVIHSARNALRIQPKHVQPKYSLIPLGNVASYSESIEKSTLRGGNVLSWLTYELPPETAELRGHFATPEHHSYIFKEFIEGTYRYVPGRRASTASDQKTIEGLWPLVMIPFLKVDPSQGEELLKNELENLERNVKNNIPLSPGAAAEFESMIRNARFGGGHNRFYIQSGNIEEKATQLSQVAKKGKGEVPLIPEFIRKANPEKRPPEVDPCQLRENSMLMNQEKFIDEYTIRGTLFHGTPKPEFALNMIRNGLVFSKADGNQGKAVYGSGFYTTQNSQTANGYGSYLVELKLKRKKESPSEYVPLRILNWDSLSSDQKEEIGRLAEVSDLTEIAKKCDLDIIVSKYPLIQNSGCVSLPQDAADLVTSAFERLRPLNPDSSIEEYSQFFYQFLPFLALSKELAPEKVQTFDEGGRMEKLILNNCRVALRSKNTEIRKLALRSLRDIKPTNKAIQREVVKQLREADFRKLAAEVIEKIEPTDSTIIRQILTYANSADADLREVALKVLKALRRQGSLVFEREHPHSRIIAHHIDECRATLRIGKVLQKQGQDLYMTLSEVVRSASESSVGHLHEAVRVGNLDTANVLLQMPEVDLNATLPTGETPLLVAAREGKIDILKLLLHAPGIDIHAEMSDGSTALHLAAQNGHVDAVRVLLNAGLDVNEANLYQLTPLHYAAENNQKEIVQILLNTHGINMKAVDALGTTPFHIAAAKGHLPVLKVFLDAGMDVNLKNQLNASALHIAAFNGHTETVQALLNAGSEVDAENRDGSTALHIAIEKGKSELAKALLRAGAKTKFSDGSTALHLAAEKGDREMLQTLISAGIPSSITNRDGSTALHSAALNNQKEIIEELVRAGCPIDQENVKHATALVFATESGNIESVRTLLRAGANIHLPNGSTALHHAAWTRQKDVVKSILESGVGVNLPDQNGTQLIHIAAQEGDLELLKTLLASSGIDLNATLPNGSTALILAAIRGNGAIVEELLKYRGVNTQSKYDGMTAFEWAMGRNESNYSSIAQKIQDYESRHSPRPAAVFSNIRKKIKEIKRGKRVMPLQPER